MLLAGFSKSRALSAGGRIWQSCAMAMVVAGSAMAAPPPLPLPAPPLSGGTLATLTIGRYVCELPGDAMGESGIHQPAEDFEVAHASTYVTRGGRGTYLMWRNQVEITSGPKKGQSFRQITPNLLRRLNPDGTEGKLRCIREVLNNR